MVLAIGITTQIISQAKWYKYVGEFGFNTIEINRQNSKLHFNLFFLEKVKRYLSGFDLSIHSGTAGIFQPYESFTKANLATLTAEIDVCRLLGARQFIFHLNDGFFSADNKKHLREVLCYAADLGVEMLYESNSILVADYAYDVLGSFPQLGYVLDLGHLNNGHGSGRLGCSIEDFVAKVKDRVVYLHASNNSGQRDEHNGLENGTLDWRRVLDMLDLPKIVKIIIEVRRKHMIEASTTELMRYLDGDITARKRCANG
ncbi:MAG: TIM barrel protein [Thermodesulfobacteriota bacterium]